MASNAKDEFPQKSDENHLRRLRDPRRLAALGQSDLMDSPEEEAFQRAVRLATNAIGAPVGLVSLVDDQRQFFKAQLGLTGQAKEDRQTPLSHSFCQYVTTEDRLLAVTDARHHPLLKVNGAVDDLDVIAYLGAPIHSPDGETLGSFCAIYDETHEWTDREKAILTDIATMLELELSLRAERDAKQLLFEEMAHRVGNLFSIVQGMINMTGRSATSVPDFVGSLTGRIGGLKRAHDLVRPSRFAEAEAQTTNSLQNIISNLVEPHLHIQHEQLKISGPTVQAGPKATTNIALIIHEIATNAAKYGALSKSSGRVLVEWTVDGDRLNLTWKEEGGPQIDAQPERQGFGTGLIRMTVEGALDGTLATTWVPTGAQHEFDLSLSRLEH